MARGSPLLSLAAGLGTGYLNTKKQIAEQARIDEDRAMQREERQLRLDDARQLRNQNAAVATAGKPIGVQEVAGTDMAPGEMGPSQTAPTLGGFKVGGSSYLDRAQADTAAAAENTPEAQTGRIAAAYRANGAPEKALTLENSYQDQRRKREAEEREAADAALKKKIYSLKTPDELASFVSEFPHDGHGGGLKTKVLMSPDSKSWQVQVSKPDGSTSVLPQTYSNDGNGLLRAQIDLEGTFKPEQRKEFYKWDMEQGAKAEKAKADATHQTGMLGAATTNAAANMIRAQRTGGGDGGGTKAPSGYRFAGDGKTLEAIPGGPADKGSNNSKPLPGSVLKQLQEVRDGSTTMSSLNDSFKDNFAGKGVLGMMAEAQLGASANMGVDKDSVDWWKNYRKTAELVQRHEMFGASLTTGEQDAWRSADIGPSMNKDVIKRNLKTRAELARKVLENSRQDFIDAGHSEDRVNAIADRGRAPTKALAPMPANNAAKEPSLPKVGVVDSGYRFKGGDPSDPKNWVKK